MEQERSSDRAEMILFGAFAAVALLLASVGIFGVMSFAVEQRTHEIGIRMALGARRSEVVRLVLSSGMRMATVGLCIGLGGRTRIGTDHALDALRREVGRRVKPNCRGGLADGAGAGGLLDTGAAVGRSGPDAGPQE